MWRFIALVCLATVCLGTPRHSRTHAGVDEHIMGGSDADIRDYPYMLSVQDDGTHFCAATLISTTWAVTAASCMNGSMSGMSLRSGSSLLEQGGVVHTMTNREIHPLFNKVTFAYDIAVVKVLPPFVLGPGTGLASLPEQDAVISAGTAARVLGWGADTETGPYLQTLQVAEVPVVDQDACAAAYAGIRVLNSMICAGVDEGNIGFCTGDIGGPLLDGDMLVGVASWSLGCSRPGYPGVYSNVAHVSNWIRAVTGA